MGLHLKLHLIFVEFASVNYFVVVISFKTTPIQSFYLEGEGVRKRVIFLAFVQAYTCTAVSCGETWKTANSKF